ncbi:MAG TPA: DNA repair protein RadC [Candidatus Saccharimonadales bacterium]|nr:DNA repair protein RadC [Candidatus Saccharimonadales bacterium]
MSAKKIKQLPVYERPREKFLQKGAAALSDVELLSLLIGSGNAISDVSTIARRVQRLLQKHGGHITLEDLLTIKGVSTVIAGRILAGLELTRRYLVRDIEPLRSMSDILGRLGHIRTRQQEYLVCLTLDGGRRLIAQRTVTIGTLDSVIVHPREVFSDAIADRAACIVVAHNHPSGNARPSSHDISLTQQLIAAGHLIGIELHDHIIVSKNDYFSYRQNHLL